MSAHEDRAHAKLSASGSSRWLNCPGSVKAEENFPDFTSDFAQWGTVCHEVSEAMLLGKPIPTDPLIDEEMLETAQVYVDYVKSLGGIQFYETRVDFSDVVPEGFGTSDAICLVDDIMYVVDLKGGKGVPVYAEENSQGMLYALGALAQYGELTGTTTVRIVIVQPRLDNISEWDISVEDLFKWASYVSEQANLALSDNAPRNPGEKQCQWCKAKATCPALLKLTHEAVASEFDDLGDVNELTDQQLRFVMDNKKLIESWLGAVEELVEQRLLAGNSFEGYKLVHGRSTRSWTNDSDALEVLQDELSEDVLWTKKFITVAAAEKALGKKKVHLLDGLVDKPEGKPTLAPAADKRPPIGVSADDFDDCGGAE